MHNEIPYLICHGSGNRFVMIDAVASAQAIEKIDLAPLARAACQALWPSPLDGLLLLVKQGEEYGMRMLNTDGSEAEMCGNGIRCVARLARERYLSTDHFRLLSGGKSHPIYGTEPIFPGLTSFGVEIAIRLSAPDFPKGGIRFLDQPIEALHPTLRFSYLNLGNPHLVAITEEIDLRLLKELGERIKSLPEWFPRGINLSFVTLEARDRLFVTTYERGVGLTHSCGTAMTASTTAAVLLGHCDADRPIEVRNRGGMVRCQCHQAPGALSTRLTGNATYEAKGLLSWDGTELRHHEEEHYNEEVEQYNQFLSAIGCL